MIMYSLGILYLFNTGCASKKNVPPVNYNLTTEVDYSQLDNWASHPDKEDLGDAIPGRKESANYSSFKTDVFFIHPTTFTDSDERQNWNAGLENIKLNKETDEQPIKYQASIFNQVGRLYAPRYRQAHLRAYYSKDTTNAKQAFELAYQDVEDAFLYYMEHENMGRPFVLASHSQGTTHAIPLLKNHIDGKTLQKQLIAAYLVGMPVTEDQFEHIEPCADPNQLNCFNTWRTFRHGHTPKQLVGDHIVSTNPITWKLDGEYAPKSMHKGAILRNFNRVFEQRVDAQSVNGILWAHRPRFPFSFLLKTNNYHIADFNFYYFNVQENAKLRTKQYLQNRSL